MSSLRQLSTEEQGHAKGMQMLGAARFWLPRVIWSTKPVKTGAMVTGDLGPERAPGGGIP